MAASVTVSVPQNADHGVRVVMTEEVAHASPVVERVVVSPGENRSFESRAKRVIEISEEPIEADQASLT